MQFVAQTRRVRSRCVAADVRSIDLVRRGVEALPPFPCGLQALPPASPLATGPPSALMPHWALPLCLAALVLRGCCDTHGRLRLVRTLLAVRESSHNDSWRTMTVGALVLKSS